MVAVNTNVPRKGAKIVPINNQKIKNKIEITV